MTRRYHTLLATAFVLGFCVVCFLAWIGGLDFDKRSAELAIAVAFAFAAGGFCAMAIEEHAAKLDRSAKYPLGEGEINLIAFSTGLRYGGSDVDECMQHNKRLRHFAREVERWHGITPNQKKTG